MNIGEVLLSTEFTRFFWNRELNFRHRFILPEVSINGKKFLGTWCGISAKHFKPLILPPLYDALFQQIFHGRINKSHNTKNLFVDTRDTFLVEIEIWFFAIKVLKHQKSIVLGREPRNSIITALY